MKNINMFPRMLLTPRDVMEILGIRKTSYHKLMKEKAIPYIVLWDCPGIRPRKSFLKKDVITFIHQRKIK